MKKSLLSILAVVAMAFVVVACGNGKIVDTQVKAIESMTAKLDSVETLEQLQNLSGEWVKNGEEWTTTTSTVKFSEAELKKLSDATTAYSAKLQAVNQKVMEAEAAKVAAAEAAAAAAAAEEEAAAKKKK